MSNIEEIKESTESPNYETVLYARYQPGKRPSNENIQTYFSRYGKIDHLECPDEKNFAIIYYLSLSTQEENHRVRSTITQIISEMDAENKFYVNVSIKRPRNSPKTSKPVPTYEVVLFVRYPRDARPGSDNIALYFNKYGVVDHIDYPENRNHAIVFMKSLNTTVQYMRTRTTINQIIKEMDPQNKFFVTVARKERNRRPFYRSGVIYNKKYAE